MSCMAQMDDFIGVIAIWWLLLSLFKIYNFRNIVHWAIPENIHTYTTDGF